MYDNENTVWFSQTLLTFKDKQFQSDGYMKLGISTNTNNYINFNPPMFNISISNNLQKSCNLNIQQAEDLLDSLATVLKQVNGHDLVVEKKYSNANIYFKFAVEQLNKTRVVIIEIMSNETDTSKIIIPLKPTFQSFMRRLKNFIENYDNLCYQLLTKSIDGNSVQILNQLPSLIKGISSQIVSKMPEQDAIQDNCAPEIKTEDVKETSMAIEDLETFLGEDMKNIKIAEIEEGKVEPKVTTVEMKSEFIEKILKNNLKTLEDKLISFAVSKQPILDFIADVEKELQFDLLLGADENSKKSIIFLSTLFQKFFSKLYIEKNGRIPSTIPLLKFNTDESSDNNLELAKDLLMIICYMREVRNKLESKTADAYQNKALFYIYLRSCVDPICFSYLKLHKSELTSVIDNRFSHFDKNGFFEEYKKLLSDNNCEQITNLDIVKNVEQVFEGMMQAKSVDVIHKGLYDKKEVKLPTKNKFTIEQITNEIIPLEVNSKLGFDFQNKEAVNEFKEKCNISDEILKHYISKTDNKIKIEKKTPLERWVDKYKQDIPDSYRDSFINFVEELKYSKFDFLTTSFPLSEFDENIVKALYVWDVDSDPNMKSNFTHFASLVENEIMPKDSILASAMKSSNNSEWDFTL